MSTPKTHLLHLMHTSLQITDTDRQFQEDLYWALSQVKPDIVSYTEIAGRHPMIAHVARECGYTPVLFSNNVWDGFCVKNDLKVADRGNVLATAGDKISGPRYINWVKVKWQGETLWYHTAHWVANLSSTPERVKRHTEITNQMAIQVRKHGRQGDLSFFSGDTNYDDNDKTHADPGPMNQLFRNLGLLTIWDEFGVYPNTHDDRTIDVIGSYNADKRVVGKRYKTHARQNSDHRPVSAWYEVTESKKWTDTGGNGGSTGGTHPHTHDPIYATGGDVDWSDYGDNTRYRYHQATDDSDGPDHGTFGDA